MKQITKLLLFGLMTIFYFGSAEICAAQEDETKSLRARGFLKNRPAQTPAGNKPFTPVKSPKPPVKERVYKYVKTKKAGKAARPAAKTMEAASLGFTMWRLPFVADDEDESKGLTEVNPQGKKMRAERLATGTSLPIGETLRIGVESLSHNGYLYIINREKFADGTYGVAKLVFPTLNSRGGNNFVRAGILTFVPAPPNYFQIDSRTDKKQIAEELTIIVSPKPLIGARLLRENAIDVSTDQLTEWIKLWETDEIQRELEDGLGETMSFAEQTAGIDQSKGLTEVAPTLTQTDAPPYTVFDMKIKRGSPILTRVLLELKPE